MVTKSKKTTKKSAKKKAKASKKTVKKQSRPKAKPATSTPMSDDSGAFQKTNIQIKEADIDRDTKNLVWVIIGIIAIFALFFVIRFIMPSEVDTEGKSVDEMHQLNLEGKLDNESSAYVYQGFSFLKLGDLWYTQLQKGNTIYDVTFNYGPRDVGDINVEGSLTKEFIQSDKFYITFDPEGEDLNHVAVANYGLSNSLVRAFGFDLKAGCLRNATPDCAKAEIITCDDEEKNIFYFKEAEEAKVIFDKNCVIMQGRGKDLVRAKDRLLLRWYNIMR